MHVVFDYRDHVVTNYMHSKFEVRDFEQPLFLLLFLNSNKKCISLFRSNSLFSFFNRLNQLLTRMLGSK